MFRILFDIRYSVRKLVRTPGLALALLLSIALGIGSNVSIYGFARGLLSRPDTPLTSVDRVVSIFTQDIVHGAGPLSYEEYLLLKNRRSTFEWIGAARVSPISITLADHSAIVSVAAVTPSLARRLNLSLGKGVVISHRMWESEFGGKANIRADQIRINGTNMRVGGVAPNWLEGLYRDRAIDLWVLVQENTQGIDRTSRSFWVLARLRRGVSTTQAQNGFPQAVRLPAK